MTYTGMKCPIEDIVAFQKIDQHTPQHIDNDKGENIGKGATIEPKHYLNVILSSVRDAVDSVAMILGLDWLGLFPSSVTFTGCQYFFVFSRLIIA